ncbi:MAG: hypothetical protein D6820_08305, partial [Lentisphaerae bacterium]
YLGFALNSEPRQAGNDLLEPSYAKISLLDLRPSLILYGKWQKNDFEARLGVELSTEILLGAVEEDIANAQTLLANTRESTRSFLNAVRNKAMQYISKSSKTTSAAGTSGGKYIDVPNAWLRRLEGSSQNIRVFLKFSGGDTEEAGDHKFGYEIPLEYAIKATLQRDGSDLQLELEDALQFALDFQDVPGIGDMKLDVKRETSRKATRQVQNNKKEWKQSDFTEKLSFHANVLFDSTSIPAFQKSMAKIQFAGDLEVGLERKARGGSYVVESVVKAMAVTARNSEDPGFVLSQGWRYGLESLRLEFKETETKSSGMKDVLKAVKASLAPKNIKRAVARITLQPPDQLPWLATDATMIIEKTDPPEKTVKGKTYRKYTISADLNAFIELGQAKLTLKSLLFTYDQATEEKVILCAGQIKTSNAVFNGTVVLQRQEDGSYNWSFINNGRFNDGKFNLDSVVVAFNYNPKALKKWSDLTLSFQTRFDYRLLGVPEAIARGVPEGMVVGGTKTANGSYILNLKNIPLNFNSFLPRGIGQVEKIRDIQMVYVPSGQVSLNAALDVRFSGFVDKDAAKANPDDAPLSTFA